MALRIGDEAPNFTAQTTEGEIDFHDWIGDGWVVLFSHPKDFTPVCTTELGYMAGLQAEFARRNTKIIGLSVDSVEDHQAWKADIQKNQGHAVGYPMIGDPNLGIAKLYEMLPAEQVMNRLSNGEIEVAPLAFMRGRTLSNAFVILDEAQNTTPVQMKMFLTRFGENSRMAVTGDLSQVDLPKGQPSGLREAVGILAGMDDVAFIEFTDADVVRHTLVTRIVRAYDARDKANSQRDSET